MEIRDSLRIRSALALACTVLITAGYAHALSECPDPYDDENCYDSIASRSVCVANRVSITCTLGDSSFGDTITAVTDGKKAYIWGVFNHTSSIERFCCIHNSIKPLIVYAGDGPDTVEHDYLTYDWEEKSTVWGEDGNDTIYGATDSLGAGAADQVIWGGDGNDTIHCGEEGCIVQGGNGDDVVCGGAGHDVIYGDADDDELFGGGGEDTIYGGTDIDYIYGENNDDELYSGPGLHDIVCGGAGDDQLFGYSGDYIECFWDEDNSECISDCWSCTNNPCDSAPGGYPCS